MIRSLILLLALALPAAAADVKGTAKEGARTGGHAARDGALTFGRSVKAFFKGGPHAAKETWKDNAARTKADARAGAHATKRAAKSR